VNLTHDLRVDITRGDATRDAQRRCASSSRASLRSALVPERSQLARSGVHHTRGSRRSGERESHV